MVSGRVIVLGSINLKLIDTWYTYLEWALLSVVYSEFSCVFCVLCCCCDTLVRVGIECHCSGACSLCLYCVGLCLVGCFWLQIQRSRVRSPALPDFLSSSGSGTGSTQPREPREVN